MHTGSRPKEWNATGDLGTNHSVPAHTKRGCPNDADGPDPVIPRSKAKKVTTAACTGFTEEIEAAHLFWIG